MGTETAQQQPPVAAPEAEHRWLQKLVGEWEYESEAQGPDGAPHHEHGTETVRSFGDLWITAEMEGGMAGGDGHHSVLTLGYDPQKARFVGTFISTSMALLWVYDGSLDAAKKILTLDCEGPSMSGDGSTAKYQDVLELVSDDERIFRSQTQEASGKWTEFMRMTYRRK
jgi:hypothetical protein